MERSSGRYSYNHNRRSGGHQSSAQSLSNNNQQHLDNHHHHHHHHHRNTSASGSGSSSLTSTTSANLIQIPMHSTNNANIATTTITNSAMPAAYGREPLTQHDELIRYIKEAWTKVSDGTTTVYRNDADQQLKNFEPFNLEEYWGQRLVQNIHVSHGHQ